MRIIETLQLTENQAQQIYELWNRTYPVQITYENIDGFYDYLNSLTHQKHYVLLDDDRAAGWLVCFERESATWFAIILDDAIQRQGWGTKLIGKAKEKETMLCGWVTDKPVYKKRSGEIYSPPLDFYLNNGFVLCPDVRLETEKLSAVKIIWKK